MKIGDTYIHTVTNTRPRVEEIVDERKGDFTAYLRPEDPMMRKYIETHVDELIYMLPGGGITFMYNPDDNRTVGYITRIE